MKKRCIFLRNLAFHVTPKSIDARLYAKARIGFTTAPTLQKKSCRRPVDGREISAFSAFFFADEISTNAARGVNAVSRPVDRDGSLITILFAYTAILQGRLADE